MTDDTKSTDTNQPKVFISYSWTDQTHKDRIKDWADMLLSQGVEVILDFYDLKEGHDKYAFMESMVTDPKVSKVLVMCDRAYAIKADSRLTGDTGVGTESQIISSEVYKKATQEKFIPIVCEYSEDRTPYLPVFLKSRKYIDFSTDENVNKNWEDLLRLIHGKPQHKKPAIGKTPAFLLDNEQDLSVVPLRSAFNLLQQAILNSRPNLKLHRQAFHDECFEHADQLRIKTAPDCNPESEAVLNVCRKLVPVRDFIIDWVLIESQSNASDEFSESLINFFERILELRTRSSDQSSWKESWFDGHQQFAYETFIYIVASLLKREAFKTLNLVFLTNYMVPKIERSQYNQFGRFTRFWTAAGSLQSAIAGSDHTRYLSPAAEIIKRHSNRSDLDFGFFANFSG